jgi:hypothetical protein
MGSIAPKLVPKMDFDKTLNATGLVMQCLFVSFAMECVTYYVPLEHPSAPDTLVEFPNVIAWSSDHLNMLWFHILQILLTVVAFFSYVCYICYIASKKITQGADCAITKRMLRRNAFILARWRPGWFVWGVVTLLRNMLLCLVPAVVEPLIIRSLLMCCLILPHALTESFAQPWRTSNNNLIDIVSSFVLAIMALLCTSLGKDNEYQRTAAVLLNASFAVLVTVICASFPYAVWSKSTKQINKRNETRSALLTEAFELSSRVHEYSTQKKGGVESFVASMTDYDDLTLRCFNRLLGNEVGTGTRQIRIKSTIWGQDSRSSRDWTAVASTEPIANQGIDSSVQSAVEKPVTQPETPTCELETPKVEEHTVNAVTI